MKKTLRIVVSLFALSSFAISQTPQTASCEMANGGMFAASCRMSCCQTQFPKTHCPMLKAATPRDFIAASAPILEVSLTAIHFAQTSVLSSPHTWISIVLNAVRSVPFFLAPTQSVRAPPSDIHLIAA